MLHNSKKDKLDYYEDIIQNYPWITGRNHKCILSPDADGLLCGLLMSYYLDWEIAGFYDGKTLLVKDGIEYKDCVFLDMEIFDEHVKSIGNHLLMWDSKKDKNRSEWNNCISLNNIRGMDVKSTFNRKYPLATIHLLLSILSKEFDIELSENSSVPLMYVDGTIKNIHQYAENVVEWLNYMDINNPNHILYNLFEHLPTVNEMVEFYKDIRIDGKRIDNIKFTDKKGNLVNLIEHDGLYDLNDKTIDNAQHFIDSLYEWTGWEFDETKWNFKNFRIKRFKKGYVPPKKKEYYPLLEKKPFSWAITARTRIEYTLENTDVDDYIESIKETIRNIE